MGLSDLSPYDSADFIDPKKGIPYQYGSPGYQAALMPYLGSQLQKQSQTAANARGAFYSGPAMADEQQAASNLLYQMTQQGSQQAEQERLLRQQEAFQQRLANQQGSNQLSAAKASGTMGAVGQGIGGLGSIGGMMLASKLGLFGGKQAPAAAGAPVSPEETSLGQYDSAPSAADISATPSYMANQQAAAAGPSQSYLGELSGGPQSGSAAQELAPGAGGPAMSSGVEFDPAFMAGTALAAGGAGYLGYNIGGNRSGTASQLGGGLGGLAGAGIGTMMMPGIGTVIGAGLGAFGGKYLGNALGGLF